MRCFAAWSCAAAATTCAVAARAPCQQESSAESAMPETALVLVHVTCCNRVLGPANETADSVALHLTMLLALGPTHTCARLHVSECIVTRDAAAMVAACLLVRCCAGSQV
jgi:hypothetical protein